MILPICIPHPEVISVGQRIGLAPVDSLTSPASILSEAEIAARGQSALSDILRTLPGLAVSRSGSSGNLTQIRVRGAEANQVLVLIDGIEAADPNTGEFDFAGLRSEDIIRVEVLRGEQSALWGADAIGGVINIITRAGQVDATNRFQASFEAGARSTYEGQISGLWLPFKNQSNSGEFIKLEDTQLTLNANLVTTGGFDISGLDTDSQNGTEAGEDDGSESFSITAGLSALEIGGVTFNARGSISQLDAQSDADNNFDGLLENTPDRLITDRLSGRIDGGFEGPLFTHLVSLSATETRTDNPGSLFANETTGRRTNLNWAAKTSIENTLFITLLAESETESLENFGGVGAGQNQTQSIRNSAIGGDIRLDFTSLGIDGLHLTGSTRHDFNDMFEDSTTWRVGAAYNLPSYLKDFSHGLRASGGAGVKNPTLTELFGFFPSFFVGNPNVEPERSIGFNLGYSLKNDRHRATFSVDYFKSDLNNEIVTDFSQFPASVINLASQSEREGVEIEAAWSPEWNGHEFRFRGSASFLEATENGASEVRRPETLGSFTLTWNPLTGPLEPLSATLGVDHTGSQIDTDFGSFSNVTLDGFTLVGLNVNYAVSERFTLTFRAENLTDEDYQEVFGFNTPGRALFGGLRYNFR